MKYTFLFIIILALLVNVSCSKGKDGTKQANFVYVNAVSGLNLREKPSKDSKSITLIPFQEHVDIMCKNKDFVTIDTITDVWVKIKWKNNEGWVFNGYLAKSEDAIPTGESTHINSLSGTYTDNKIYIKFINDAECIIGYDDCERIRESTYQYIIQDGVISIYSNPKDPLYELQIIDEESLHFTKGFKDVSCGIDTQPVLCKKV